MDSLNRASDLSSSRLGGASRRFDTYRRLLPSFLRRDLKVKYQRSLLGFLWTLINPIIVSLILITVFSWVVRIPIENYWAFLLSGYFSWNFTQQCIGAAGNVFQEHAALRRNVRFPIEALVLGASLSRLVEFCVEIAIVLALVSVLHHGSVPSSIVLLPLLIVVQVLIALGFMFPISIASVLFQDIQNALPVGLLSLFYVSPILYPVALVPEFALPWYYANPLAGPLELFHVTLYEGSWPSLSLLGGSLAGAVVFCAIGYVTFAKFKNDCIESA
jgi:ABC-type polysaccharide/polyol phosphate export permease